MTQLQSNLGKRAVALALMLGFLTPAFAFAQDGDESAGINLRLKASTTAGVGINFCSNIDKLTANITARIPKREVKRDDHMDKRIATVNGRFELRLGKLDDHRDQWDENRGERYDKIEARATTTAQKAAVTTFETNVDAAIKVRRTAIDASVKTFQDGVNKALADRQAKIDAAFVTLKAATDAANAKAKAACASGTDAKSVRVTLAADIKAANDAFAASTKPSSTIEVQVQALRQTRDAAVKAAIDTFKVTLDAELIKLKAAFGV